MIRAKLAVVVFGVVVVAAACGKKSADAEAIAIAETLCACADAPCATAAMDQMLDWEKRNPHAAGSGGAALIRGTECAAAVFGRATAPVAADAAIAAVPADAAAVAIASDAAPDPTPPPPEPPDEPALPARPPGVTDAQVAKLDATIAAIQAMGTELAATDDCKLAAQIVLKHWKGFKPLKKVMREINPKQDPAIDEWLESTYLRQGLGAMNPFMNKACDDPDWDRAGEVQDFLGLKTVR